MFLGDFATAYAAERLARRRPARRGGSSALEAAARGRLFTAGNLTSAPSLAAAGRAGAIGGVPFVALAACAEPKAT